MSIIEDDFYFFFFKFENEIEWLIYFYRDVASRNCLVNAQRIVKLADFGMTRPMYENDYYKFSRKGKFNTIIA